MSRRNNLRNEGGSGRPRNPGTTRRDTLTGVVAATAAVVMPGDRAQAREMQPEIEAAFQSSLDSLLAAKEISKFIDDAKTGNWPRVVGTKTFASDKTPEEWNNLASRIGNRLVSIHMMVTRDRNLITAVAQGSDAQGLVCLAFNKKLKSKRADSGEWQDVQNADWSGDFNQVKEIEV